MRNKPKGRKAAEVGGCKRGTAAVRALSHSRCNGVLCYGPLRLICALGRTGRRAAKREGDGATPMGLWPVRAVRYRSDRVRRPCAAVPVHIIRPDYGWCDDARDRNYNRPVRHPYPASAESMWRSDHLYDVVVELGYNDRPRVRGRGSAIFLHIARTDYGPTAGCVALSPAHLMRLLAMRPALRAIRIIG